MSIRVIKIMDCYNQLINWMNSRISHFRKSLWMKMLFIDLTYNFISRSCSLRIKKIKADFFLLIKILKIPVGLNKQWSNCMMNCIRLI